MKFISVAERAETYKAAAVNPSTLFFSLWEWEKKWSWWSCCFAALCGVWMEWNGIQQSKGGWASPEWKQKKIKSCFWFDFDWMKEWVSPQPKQASQTTINQSIQLNWLLILLALPACLVAPAISLKMKWVCFFFSLLHWLKDKQSSSSTKEIGWLSSWICFLSLSSLICGLWPEALCRSTIPLRKDKSFLCFSCFGLSSFIEEKRRVSLSFFNWREKRNEREWNDGCPGPNNHNQQLATHSWREWSEEPGSNCLHSTHFIPSIQRFNFSSAVKQQSLFCWWMKEDIITVIRLILSITKTIAERIEGIVERNRWN